MRGIHQWLVNGEFPAQRASNTDNVSMFPFDGVIMLKKNCDTWSEHDKYISMFVFLFELTPLNEYDEN